MEKKLNTVANNLSNMETTGFKKQRVNFEDLYYDNLRYPGSQDVAGEFTATGIAIGVGTRVTSVQSQFTQGTLTETERPFDIAIFGEGFFRELDPFTNEVFYTRAGNFSLNEGGTLVAGSSHNGRLIDPQITIPLDATAVQIDQAGRVWVIQGEGVEQQEIGRIQLTTFINPEGLLRMGENLFRETEASGAPNDVFPGENNVGQVRQKYLEMSNVAPVTELINMITSQRAYEMNSKSTQTGDQMLQTVISIKR